MKEAWGGRVTVAIYHVPESEDFEGGFEAVTMNGVPHDVSVTGSNPDSVEAALDHLLKGLRVFGFYGNVLVEDISHAGRVERYEIQQGS